MIKESYGDRLGVCRAYLDDLVISGRAEVLLEILSFRGMLLACCAEACTSAPTSAASSCRIKACRTAYTNAVCCPGRYTDRLLSGTVASLKDFGDALEILEHGQMELLLHTYSGATNRVMHLFRSLPSCMLHKVTQACNTESIRLLQRLTDPAATLSDSMVRHKRFCQVAEAVSASSTPIPSKTLHSSLRPSHRSPVTATCNNPT
jgi:hypothetical protein